MQNEQNIIICTTIDGKASVALYARDSKILLNHQQIAELFGTSVQNISMHIDGILKDNELDKDSVVKNYLTTAADGKQYDVVFYSLEMILAIGYRVRGVRGTQFRQWATRHLAEYLVKGFTMDDERLKNPNLLLFDSGDFSQGSPYYSLFKGDVEIGLMNQMKYDAATIGNHEFDYGLENMARLFLQADFPVVCANYDFTGTPCQGIVKPYTVIEREGIRIGVFGLSPKLEGLVYQELYRGVKYLDPVTMYRRTL